MDTETIIHKIETDTVNQDYINDLRIFLKKTPPTNLILKDLEILYSFAILYRNGDIIHIVVNYLLSTNCQINESGILSTIYYSNCSKNNFEKYPLFSELSYEETQKIRRNYREFLNTPFICKSESNKEFIPSMNKRQCSCDIL